MRFWALSWEKKAIFTFKPDDDLARRRRLVAAQDPGEGRFSRPVHPDDGRLLSPVEGEIDVVEDGEIPVGLGEAADGEDLLAAPGALGEADRHGLSAPLLPDEVELLQLLQAALDLARLRGLVAEALDEFADPLDLRPLELHLLFQGLAAPLLLAQVVGVVPLVDRDRPVGELGDHGDDLVQKDAVVGDGDDRAGIVLEPALQPLQTLRVQVVGRLVEEHDVRPGEEDDGEHDPHLPAAGEIPAVLGEIAFPKPESGEDLFRLRLEGVAVLRLEAGDGVFVLLQELLVGRVIRIGLGERLLAQLHRLLQRGEAALLPEIVHEGHGVELDQILGEVADRHPFAVGDLDRAAIQIDAAEDRPQEGCLSRPVVADEADPAAVRDRPGDPVEDLPVGERQADVPQVDQCPSNLMQ